jgi:hypothetical protein
MEASVVREELRLDVGGLARYPDHLLGVCEALVHQLRRRQRPVAGVESGNERFRIVEAPRHVDRLLAHEEAALDRLACGAQLCGEASEQLDPERAVGLGEGSERLLEKADAGRPGLEPGEEDEAAERGHVSERCAGELFAGAKTARNLGCLLVALARRAGIAGAPLGVAQSQKELAAPLGRRLLRRAEQLEGAGVMGRSLLVGQQAGRAVARAEEVVDGLVDIAERSRESEVVGDLRQWRVGVSPAQFLEHSPDHQVQLEAPARREVFVQGLANQLVHERIAPPRGTFQNDARLDGLRDDIEEPLRTEPTRVLEHAEVELAADDRSNVQRGDRLVGKTGHTTPDQAPHFLRHPKHRIPDCLVGVAEQPSGREEAHHLAEEEGVSSRDRMEPRRVGT